MKIYKNLWAGYDCYFIKTHQSGQYAYGYMIHNAYGSWDIKSAKYYLSDIKKDREHFPIVGNISLKDLVIKTALKEVGIEPSKDGKLMESKESMTNGEKIQSSFPNKCPHIGFNENYGRVWIMEKGKEVANFALDWWNAKYKEPKTEHRIEEEYRGEEAYEIDEEQEFE